MSTKGKDVVNFEGSVPAIIILATSVHRMLREVLTPSCNQRELTFQRKIFFAVVDHIQDPIWSALKRK